MPEEDKKIDLKKLKELVALIVTKKEDPTDRHLSFFGWDDRYELEGKKGATFSHSEVAMLNAIGLKEKYWNISYVFIDFDQLLSLYPYSECLLDTLEKYFHRTDVQRLTSQIADIESALSISKKQLKDFERIAFNKVLVCIKKF